MRPNYSRVPLCEARDLKRRPFGPTKIDKVFSILQYMLYVRRGAVYPVSRKGSSVVQREIVYACEYFILEIC